jgi:hypothetical protein
MGLRPVLHRLEDGATKPFIYIRAITLAGTEARPTKNQKPKTKN